MQDLVSVGKLAETLQRSPREIEEALTALGLEASLRLNDVDHFDRSVVNRLRGFFYNLEKGN